MENKKNLVRGVSFIYLVTLCGLWASPYWPEKTWWLADLFLIMPLWLFFLPLVFLFTVGVLAKAKGAIAVNVLSFIIIIFCIMDFNLPGPDIARHEGLSGDHLRVMSYNMGTNMDFRSLNEYILKNKPDIIALQEVCSKNHGTLKGMLRQDQWYLDFQSEFGLASRLKVRKAEVKNRQFLGGDGGIIGKYDLEGPMGIVHFFNVHLETPRKGLEALKDNLLEGISEMRGVALLQKTEAAIASGWIDADRRVLVAGDFNMTVKNPVYKKNWSRFADAFSKAGHGFGYTYYTDWHGVRIDHLLCDDEWKVIRFQVGPDLGSDHRPILVDLEFIGKKEKVPPENLYEKKVLDENTLIFDDFEVSFGGFKNSEMTEMNIDPYTTYKDGKALRIQGKAGAELVAIGTKTEDWYIDRYPMVSFSYMIPQGVGMGMTVRTAYNDWVFLGGTGTCNRVGAKIKNDVRLIDDGQWHEVEINVESEIKSLLPGVKDLPEFRFYIYKDTDQKNLFWIDDFKIYRKL